MSVATSVIERKISWRLTRVCNLHCVHCLAGHANLVRRDLFGSERVAVLDSIVEAGVTRITWTGGEPTLCDDLPLLLEIAHAHLVSSVVTTHGLALRPQVFNSIDPRLDKLRFSFDGLETTHNKVRQGPFYARTLAAADEAISRGFDVEANVTVLADNLPEIPELIQVLAAHGVSRVVLLTLTLRESAQDNNLTIPAESDLDRLVRKLERLPCLGKDIVVQLNRYSHVNDSYVVVESDGEILLSSESNLDISYGSALGYCASARIASALAAQTLGHREYLGTFHPKRWRRNER